MIKKQRKLIQFGDPVFPELTMKKPEELYETITEDRFVAMLNAYKFRESQLMNIVETANDFQYRWHDLNNIQKCLKFHNHRQPDTTGTGNQSAAPESEQYNKLEHTILTDNPQDNIPSGEHVAHFLKYQPDSRYGPRDIRNFRFGEGMFD